MRQSSADSTGPEMEYCGKLHFALRYDKDVEGLVVKVYSTTLIELPISSWGDINLIHNYMLVPFKEGSINHSIERGRLHLYFSYSRYFIRIFHSVVDSSTLFML